MAGHDIEAKAVLGRCIVLLGMKACWVVGGVLMARWPKSWFLRIDLALGCRQGFPRLRLHLLPWSEQGGEGGAVAVVHGVNILALGFV